MQINEIHEGKDKDLKNRSIRIQKKRMEKLKEKNLKMTMRKTSSSARLMFFLIKFMKSMI